MIEKLLAPGSILELAMRRYVLGKNTFTLISHSGQAVYPLWSPSFIKDLQTEPKKGLLCFGVVRQEQGVLFIQTSEL